MKKISLLISILVLSACAQSSDKIQASYVSPLQYQEFSCKQIRGEIGRVGRKMSDISGVQDKIASDDAVATGVGIVLFWPALFFIEGSDQKVEVARLKGEFDALEQVAIQKNCDVVREIAEARKIEERRLSEKKERQQRNNNN